MKLLLAIIFSILCLVFPHNRARNIMADGRFAELAHNVHGENRYRLLNALHRDYGIDRDAILEAIKELQGK